MTNYQDKESAKDDYSHEKKLAHDGRYELVHGKRLQLRMILIMHML